MINNILNQKLKTQKEFFDNNNYTSVKYRKKQLGLLYQMIKRNEKDIINAIQQDFRSRSISETYIAEIIPSLHGIQYIKKHLKTWIKKSPRTVEMFLQPASAKVVQQPLGNVGIMVPWNYPLFLAVGPLCYSIAAGNTNLLKMSEYTPHFSELFQTLIAETFPPEFITVVNGGPEVAQTFSQLPFDHLAFTGSTEIGKKLWPVLLKT